MESSLRGNLIGNRFVVRKGTFTISGDNVSLSIRMPHGNIDCHHVVMHKDNNCSEAAILGKFDMALGGKATQRDWDYLTFPVWHFSKLPPPSRGIDPDYPASKAVRRFEKWSSSAMIARTDADCHGNVVDGDQLQSDLDVSPRTAAGYSGPISFQLTQALSKLDDLLGKEPDFFKEYHTACITIQADKLASDDFFFSAQTDAACNLLSSVISTPNGTTGMRRKSAPLAFTKDYKSHPLVEISELSPRRFKKLMFTASVFVLEKLRQRPLTKFSNLGSQVASMFALNFSFACGLLCRILPPSSIIGINKCTFTHANEIDAEGRVILDRELTLKDVFLGEEKIYGKVLDSKTIVARGSEVDNVCVVLERRDTLHIVEAQQKTKIDSADSSFRVVEDAGQLIVGSSVEESLLRGMSTLSEQFVKETASQTSSPQRAIRTLCNSINYAYAEYKQMAQVFSLDARFPVEKFLLIQSGGHPHILRTAMVSGMVEASDEAKVEKVMRSMHGIAWSRAIRKAIVDMYMTKITKQNDDVDSDDDNDVNMTFTSDLLVHVSTSSDDQVRESNSDTVWFRRINVVMVAALIRAGIALGMRIERPAGTVFMEGNGRDRMVLTVQDDEMEIATHSKFGDGTPPSEASTNDILELRKKGFCI